jgi:hypothetical protein
MGFPRTLSEGVLQAHANKIKGDINSAVDIVMQYIAQESKKFKMKSPVISEPRPISLRPR